MNNISLLGRLVKDPELRRTQQGTAAARFTVAVDRGLSKEKRQQAEANNQPTADFINCIAWGKAAELISNYFSKGSRIGIVGRIQTGSYEKNGQRIYTTDVVVNSISFIDSKSESNNNFSNTNNTNNTQDDFENPGFFPIDNNDIPF
ncbi:single-stranded DNA-binding protein [Peptoniphilus sp. MSJ-1]|uniref:Single-stranded DNA-binding protein n=1 Tax=Peptoniphilus ovalis TaxID=2841503 RepID=A0ABS6FH99_9FIRM|nr:single-stranded DNA-binding protein [Peptoniphilus ovalis]MBU5669552.1 single-stranded DNA-binding protein [Peptoniphilus ovalis]